jgi:hypothetical protein
VSDTLVLPHSFTSKMKRAAAAQRAWQIHGRRHGSLPTCRDSLKVCVSNPTGPVGQDRRWLGGLQAGPCSHEWGPGGLLPRSESAWAPKSGSPLQMLPVGGKRLQNLRGLRQAGTLEAVLHPGDSKAVPFQRGQTALVIH